MSDKTKYYDGVGYPNLTDMFVQQALRLASGEALDEARFRALRGMYLDLAVIHKEPDPDKLITKIGLALSLAPGDEPVIYDDYEAKLQEQFARLTSE